MSSESSRICRLPQRNLPTLCRACLSTWPAEFEWPSEFDPHDGHENRCPACGVSALRSHAELFSLTIAHIDCDAFYAAVEKRDNPSLRDRPVIVGGTSNRGVVTTACYIARRYGPRSAMPMFKALKLCPDAVVIKPDMAKYKAVSNSIRQLMLELTPIIEPLSLDEAYLDLSDDVRHQPDLQPAVLLAGLAKRVKAQVGISISIGLAPNKFLAKLASDMDKPRGFAVIGSAEARRVLAPMPVGRIHGIGPAMQAKLEARGITEIRQLQSMSDDELRSNFGKFGGRLAEYVRGRDPRRVTPTRVAKSVSSETTFGLNLSSADDLRNAVEPLCNKVAERLARSGLAGRTITLKLKTADFQVLTRNRRLSTPTQRPDVLKSCASHLIQREANGRSFRLIGIGVSDLSPAADADLPDLFT